MPVFTALGVERKKHSIPLGFVNEITMRAAKARKQQIMATINAGKFVFQSQIPFRDLVQRFLTVHVPTLGSATRENYQTQIKNHILPAFGDHRLCDITKPVVAAWLSAKASEHEVRINLPDGREITKTAPALSWWSRSQLRGILSGIFSKAQEWSLWDGRNPCEGIDIGQKKAKRVHRIPKGVDLLKFISEISESSVIDRNGAQLIVLTACVAGLRVSEVLGLCPSDIDPEAETLQIERRWRRGDQDDPKSESSRRVRQIGGLAQRLLAFAKGKAQASYIFTRRDGRPLDDRELQREVFRPAAERVGIYYEGFGMHVFRRLNVTWRQQAGATPIEAQKAAGHASLDMTMLYTQTEEEREREHVKKIMERLGLNEDTSAREGLQRMKTEGGVQ